jgi:glycosyltransferase involved in cell wall biosynthesis
VRFHGEYRGSDLEGTEFDVAAIPTLYAETHSFVLDEALDLGLPVLASRFGAIPERIGGRGFLFERGDARDLARVLGEILRDPGSLRRAREAEVPARVALDEQTRRIRAVYERAIVAAPPDSARVPPSPTDADVETWRTREARLRERMLRAKPGEVQPFEV